MTFGTLGPPLITTTAMITPITSTSTPAATAMIHHGNGFFLAGGLATAGMVMVAAVLSVLSLSGSLTLVARSLIRCWPGGVAAGILATTVTVWFSPAAIGRSGSPWTWYHSGLASPWTWTLKRAVRPSPVLLVTPKTALPL